MLCVYCTLSKVWFSGSDNKCVNTCIIHQILLITNISSLQIDIYLTQIVIYLNTACHFNINYTRNRYLQTERLSPAIGRYKCVQCFYRDFARHITEGREYFHKLYTELWWFFFVQKYSGKLPPLCLLAATLEDQYKLYITQNTVYRVTFLQIYGT